MAKLRELLAFAALTGIWIACSSTSSPPGGGGMGGPGVTTASGTGSGMGPGTGSSMGPGVGGSSVTSTGPSAGTGASTGASTACKDTQTDVNNCGACGIACVAPDPTTTASCFDGSCVFTRVLRTGPEVYFTWLVSAGDAVYFTEYTGLSGNTPSLLKCPVWGCAGGAVPFVLHAGGLGGTYQTLPFGADATDAYWLDTKHNLVTCPLSGCTAAGPTVLVPAETSATLMNVVASIGVGAQGAVFANVSSNPMLPGAILDTDIGIISAAQPIGKSLADGAWGTTFVAVGAQNAYFDEWTGQPQPLEPLMACSTSGGVPVPLGSGMQQMVRVTSDGTDPAWAYTAGSPQTYHVFACSDASCTPTELVPGGLSTPVNDLALDQAFVYWRMTDKIWRCTRPSCAAPEQVAETHDNLGVIDTDMLGLAVDGKRIFWIQFAQNTTNQYQVVAMSKPCGGAPCSCVGEALCGSECRDVADDVANCGACGHACGAVANGTPACHEGQCAPVCSAGYADCDGNPANGCEAALASDPQNCGACQSTCASGTCNNGQCSSVGTGDAGPEAGSGGG